MDNETIQNALKDQKYIIAQVNVTGYTGPDHYWGNGLVVYDILYPDNSLYYHLSIYVDLQKNAVVFITTLRPTPNPSFGY